MRVAIIDYGSGNLHSVTRAFMRAGPGVDVFVTQDPEQIRTADRIVLPGVGAFSSCYQGLTAIPGMIDALNQAVRSQKKPFLGICVGMQLLAEYGEEHGLSQGLGWIKGRVSLLRPENPACRVPHVGWNDLHYARPHVLLQDFSQHEPVYFVHSYAMIPDDSRCLLCTTTHGHPVTAAIVEENIAGVQFHPEKSQATGLKFIRNFLNWIPDDSISCH